LVLAASLAFATGALISALSFELFAEAHRGGGPWASGLAFAAGAVVFVVADTVLDRFSAGSVAGPALLAGVTLDGVPENTALGVTLGTGGSIALLVAVFVSNFPEALSGAVSMRENGVARGRILLLWATATTLLAAAVVAGSLLFDGASPGQLALPLAFAAGAVLASVVDTLAPEAFKDGGPWIALASAAGFFTAFMLSQ
jgi:ZIP family zinc transporter